MTLSWMMPPVLIHRKLCVINQEYKRGSYALTSGRKHPKYKLDVVPIMMRSLGVVIDDYQWSLLRPGVVNYMQERHGPYSDNTDPTLARTANKRSDQMHAIVHDLRMEKQKRMRLEQRLEDVQQYVADQSNLYLCGAAGRLASWSKNMYYDKIPVWRGAYLSV